MKKLVKDLMIFLLVLLLLLTLFSLVELKRSSDYAYRYKNFSPPVCPNTKWVCLEKDLYFFSNENGSVSGAGTIAGAEIAFGVHFLIPSDGGGFIVYTSFIGPSGPGDAVELWGSAYFEEDKCVLKYKAKDDYEAFWGEEEGAVTLTFLREDLPDPADPSGDA